MTALGLAVVVLLLVVLYQLDRLKRDVAWVHCQLDGHWPPKFPKIGESGLCGRCGKEIATRPIEQTEDAVGMPLGEDTIFQRVLKIEAKLGIDE